METTHSRSIIIIYTSTGGWYPFRVHHAVSEDPLFSRWVLQLSVIPKGMNSLNFVKSLFWVVKYFQLKLRPEVFQSTSLQIYLHVTTPSIQK